MNSVSMPSPVVCFLPVCVSEQNDSSQPSFSFAILSHMHLVRSRTSLHEPKNLIWWRPIHAILSHCCRRHMHTHTHTQTGSTAIHNALFQQHST